MCLRPNHQKGYFGGIARGDCRTNLSRWLDVGKSCEAFYQINGLVPKFALGEAPSRIGVVFRSVSGNPFW